MKVNFNGKSDSTDKSEVMHGGYEKMLKMREEKLPEIQEAINEVFKDYDVGSVAIIVMKEDENGMPSGRHLFMGGVSRPEVQLFMSKALFEASDDAVNVLLEAAKKNPKQFVELTKQLLDFMGGKE